MRAVVVTAPGAAPAVEEIELAAPLGDEVVVAIGATGICHTDLSSAAGRLGDAFPVVLGHEAAGTVAECGAAVTHLSPGDRVVVSIANHCGRCRYCERGYAPLCESRFAGRERYLWRGAPIAQAYGTGTFATTTVLPQTALVPVPDGVPLGVAAVTGCAVITGYGAVVHDAQVRAHSTVAVVGCGGVGASIVMAARASGAERVVAVDPDPRRRELALRLGATDAVEPAYDALRELEPRGFDHVFESAGRVDAMELALSVAAPAGVIVLTGLPGSDARLAVPIFGLVASAQQLIGSNLGRVRPQTDFAAIFDLYQRGALPLDILVGATFPLDDAAAAWECAAGGEHLRVLLLP